jgi:hypothetical protein
MQQLILEQESNLLLRQQLKSLSTDALYLVFKDASSRIGNHYIGGNPDMGYIRKQEEIISGVQDELGRRKEGSL